MKLVKPGIVVAAFSAISLLGLEIPAASSDIQADIAYAKSSISSSNDELVEPLLTEVIIEQAVNGINTDYSPAHKLLTDHKEKLDKNYENSKRIAAEYVAKELETQNRMAEELEVMKSMTPPMTLIGTFELTAYIATGNRCASGVYPTVNHTVACNSLPLGTRIYIEGYGEFVVEDTGGMAGNVIDVFVSDYSTAISFGRRTAAVYVID